MDDHLKNLMKELGAAINDALAESGEISDAIQNVRDAGYDIFLVLEATIGFNKRTERESADASASPNPDIRLRVTAQDVKFLKSLKISPEDLDSP